MELRDDVETTDRGRVILDRALVDEMWAAAPRRSSHSPRPASSPRTCSSSPPASIRAKNELEELGPVIEGLAPHPVAVEFRRRSWASAKRFEHVLDWLSEHGAVFV